MAYNVFGMVSVFGGLITTKINNMCTKKQIQEAKKYLSEQGYGTGSNFTVNAVANLMAEWLAKNCTIPVVTTRFYYFDCWDKTGELQTKPIKATCEEHATLLFEKEFGETHRYDPPYN